MEKTLPASRVLVIGMDGATLDLLEPWAQEGKLPNFKKLMKEGAYGTLLSTAFYGSAPAWSSFITGKNPGKHGIYFFTEHVQGSYQVRLVNASMRNGESFWSLLSQRGKRVGIMNVPMTYPPEPVNGFSISGMDTPSPKSNFTYPAQLKDELHKITGGYKIEVGVWGMISAGKPQQAIDNLKNIIRMRGKVARHLMQTKPWELFTVVFTATDRIQHFFWKYLDQNHPQYNKEEGRKYGTAILEIYQALDEELGQFMDLMDSNTHLLILSDHGAGPNSDRSIYLNRWLEKEGFLFYKKGKSNQNSQIKTSIKTKLIRKLSRLSRQYLSRPMKEKLLTRWPGLINWSISTMRFGDIDWSRTRAYSEESAPWIWINLKGREAQGVVSPGQEYEETCKAITKAIKRLRDPKTNDLIIENVFRREELFHGPLVNKAPDLSIFFKNDHYISRKTHYNLKNDSYLRILNKQELDLLEKDAKSSASHRRNGIIFLYGPWVKPSGKRLMNEIIDVTPTILYLFDEEIPNDYDGQVILEAIKDEVAMKKKVRYCQTNEENARIINEYDQEDNKKLTKRLEDLGYL